MNISRADVQELLAALGAPKYTTKLNLLIEPREITISCEYVPEEVVESKTLTKLTARIQELNIKLPVING